MTKDSFFSIDDTNNYYNLPNHILGYQFYSTFTYKVVENSDKYIRYKINATIERDYHLNTYDFYIVYNKYDNKYVLLNKDKYTVETVEDMEDDFSIIEPEIMNVLLKLLMGYIPRFYFGNDTNIVLPKIQKYLNNRLYKLLKKYKYPFIEYSGCVEDGDNYDIFHNYRWIPEKEYETIVYNKIYDLMENLSETQFKYNGKKYTFNNPLNIIKYFNGCYYNYKVPISSLKILDIN